MTTAARSKASSSSFLRSSVIAEPSMMNAGVDAAWPATSAAAFEAGTVLERRGDLLRARQVSRSS